MKMPGSRLLLSAFAAGSLSAAETPHEALLVLNKGDMTLAIVDPVNKVVVATAPAGRDPHEVVASADGKLAFISNYGGGHTLSVVDLVAQKALDPVELGAFRSPHGLALGNGKVYFTAEGSRMIGSYDPAARQIDWALGLGQDRTHMVVVSKDGKKIYTSNVNSDTISFVEQGAPGGGFGGRRGGPPNGPGGPGGPGGFGGPPPGGPAGPPNGPPPGGPGGPGGPGRGGPPGGGPGGFGPSWAVQHVAVGSGPEGFDLSPDEKEVWAANSHDGSISVIDVASKKIVATIKTSARFANRLKFTPDGKHVLVSDLGGQDLEVIDAGGRASIKKIPLGGGAAGLQMEPGGERAYAAVGSRNGVVVIDLKTLEATGLIETGPGPDGLAWAVRN
jgi:YVTN family beta-propeller protein